MVRKQNANSLFLVLQLSVVESKVQIVLQRDLTLGKTVALRATVYADNVVRHLQIPVFLVSYVRAPHSRMGAATPVARLLVRLREHLWLDFKTGKRLVSTLLVPAGALRLPADGALREERTIARVVVAAADLALHQLCTVRVHRSSLVRNSRYSRAICKRASEFY